MKLRKCFRTEQFVVSELLSGNSYNDVGFQSCQTDRFAVRTKDEGEKRETERI